MTIVTERLSLDDLDHLPLDEAKTRRPDVFRLRPDRRFLMAIGERQLLVDPGRPVRVHVAWSDGAWRIESSGRAIGAVPEVASYEDLRRLLSTSRSASNATTAPAATLDEIRADCDRFEPEASTRALQKIDAIWPASGPPDPALAALAARAYVVLCVQGLDDLEMADLLRGRAMALLSLAEAPDRPPDAAEEALLAMSMGYAPESARIASALPPEDPVRMYAERRTPELVRAARLSGAAPRTRYLALLSLGERRDVNGWMKFQREQFGGDAFSLPLLRSAEALHDFGVDSGLGKAVVYASMASLPGIDRRPTPAAESESLPTFHLVVEVLQQFVGIARKTYNLPSANVTQFFERGLEKTASGAHGRLWDQHAVRAWHRGGFYSGLYLMGRFNLDQLGSVEDTKELAAYLQGSPEGPAAQFAKWYGDVSAALLGGRANPAQIDDLVTLTALGGPAVQRTAESVERVFYNKHDSESIVAARVAERLDARPPNVAYMSTLAAYPLQDPLMVERLCRGWLERGWTDPLAPQSMTGHCLWFNGDSEAFSRLVADRAVPVIARSQVLYNYCLLQDSSERFCRATFPRLVEESGYAEEPIQGWSYYLQHGPKDFAAAQRAVETWLAHHDKSAGLMWSVFVGRRAGIIGKQGRYAEAWTAIQPALLSGQGSVLCWGVDILVGLGRLDEAYAMARSAVERYPGSAEARATLAGVLWRQKRYSEAAFVLDPPEVGYKVEDFAYRDEVAPRFAAVFDRASDDAVLAAFAAIQGQGIRARSFASLIPPLADAGRYDLAFREQSTLSLKGLHMWDVGDQILRAAGYLEKARGATEAVEWIRSAVTPEKRETCLEAFFCKKGWGMVWDAVPPAEEAKLSDWAWLLRAGASTADASVDRVHRPALLEHYQSPKPGSADHVIGRYLAGLEPRPSVLAAATSRIDRCKAAYFFGLQDVVAGRYEDGAAWYAFVHDACAKEWGWRLERFALATLGEWYTFDRNLRQAAAHRVW